MQLTFPSVSEQETLVRHFASRLLRGMHANLNPSSSSSSSSSSSVAADIFDTCIVSRHEQEHREKKHINRRDDEVVQMVALASQVLQEVEAEMLDILRKQNTFQPSIW